MADFERPLKRRGREAAEAMGRFLASKKVDLSATYQLAVDSYAANGRDRSARR